MDVDDLDFSDNHHEDLDVGDPALRSLVGLVDVGALAHLRLTVDSSGGRIVGLVLSSDQWAAITVDRINELVGSTEGAQSFADVLRVCSEVPPGADSDGFLRADYLHMLELGPLPDVVTGAIRRHSDGPRLWRLPVAAVQAWSMDNN